MKKYIFMVLLVATCSIGYSDTNEELFTKWRDDGMESVMTGNLKNAQVCFKAALTFKSDDAEVKKALAMIEQRLSNEQEPMIVEVQQQATDIPARQISSTKKADKGFSVRISVGSAPGINKTDNVGEVGGWFFSDSSDQESSGLLEIFAVQRFWGQQNPSLGLVFGGGLLFAEHKGSLSETFTVFFTPQTAKDEYKLNAIAGVLEVGGALKLGDNVIFEVKPFYGFGSARQEITTFVDDGSGGSFYEFNGDADATYTCYGVKGSAFVLLGDHVELGLEVGSHSFSSDSDIQGSSRVVTFSGTGMRVAGTLSIKF